MNKDYGYTIGLVRALEQRLLNTSHVERMLDAVNAQEAFSVLYDTDYADVLSDEARINDMNTLLESSLLQTKRRLDQVAPNKVVLKGIWAWYDFYNVKTALKAFLQGKDFDTIESLLSSFGSIDFAKVRAVIYNQESLEGFSPLRDKAITLYNQHNNIRIVDFVFDRALFEYLQLWAKSLGNTTIENFVKTHIDITNAQSFVRLTDEERSTFGEYVFIPGGNKPVWNFLGSKEEGNAATISILGSDEGLKNVTQEHQFTVLTKQANDLLTKLIHQGRYASSGPEALIGYWWARQKSADVIRMAMGAKVNNIDTEKTRSLIHNLY